MSRFIHIIKFILLFFCASTEATVILQYHHISDSTPKSTSLSPSLFRQHLAYLEDNNFKVISLGDLLESLEKQSELPEKSVVITFDDGYRSIYDTAFPLLKERGFPFTVFVNTSPIKNKLNQFMGWQELKELTRYGGQIANHSITHPHFIRRLNDESERAWVTRIKSEITDAQALIEKNTGTTLKAIAYPYGEFNNSVKAIVKELEFAGFGQQSGAVSLDVDRQSIPRFPLGGFYGKMEDFVVKVNSLPLPLNEIQLYDDNGSRIMDFELPQNVERPQLKLSLKNSTLVVSCYLSGQGLLPSKKSRGLVVFQPEKPLPSGRSRFNCTAPTGKKGQFYWFSQPWIRRNPDGSWYTE